MSKTTVVFHSADMDGIFCSEIARKFLPDAKLVGWDFADAPLPIPEGNIYVLDLPVDRVFGLDFRKVEDRMEIDFERVCWIDHHASSIASHPTEIPGYRIDGVAACRLAWQWFRATSESPTGGVHPVKWPIPSKDEFVGRTILEPLAVRLAGEYDIWDKRDERADIFQFGLQSRELHESDWRVLLAVTGGASRLAKKLCDDGKILQTYQQRNDKSAMGRSFVVEWEGLKFLALTTARCNSLTFASKDVPETGHDALMGFYFNGKTWTVSLYHAKHRTDIDLSQIAVKHGGGGHRGACGFVVTKLPFIP